MKHELWMWLWFLVGMTAYILKRAYYAVQGPNQALNSYPAYFKQYMIPLIFRVLVDCGIFWFCYTPALLLKGMNYLGWTNWGWVIQMVTQLAPAALFFGLGIDFIMDLVFDKFGLQDWRPPILAAKS